MLSPAVQNVCCLSGVSTHLLNGVGLAFGVGGHRLHVGPRRRLCCLLSLRSAVFFLPAPATSHQSGIRGVSSAGYCMLAYSWLWAPVCPDLTILSGGRSAYPGSAIVSASFLSNQSLFFLDDNQTTSARFFLCNASFRSCHIFSGAVSMTSMGASLFSSLF